MRFVPRVPELLRIEGNYDGIILSCRHKDILRCSDTKHFSSCFAKGHMYEVQPVIYCYRKEVCIIGKKSRSGDWTGRVFGFYENDAIKLSKIYGNGLTINEITSSISSVRFMETGADVYFPVP